MKTQETLSITFFLHSRLNVLMEVVGEMRKIFQVHTFKEGINIMKKFILNFYRCSAVDIAVFHEPSYIFLLWSKMLIYPSQRHQFEGKT